MRPAWYQSQKTLRTAWENCGLMVNCSSAKSAEQPMRLICLTMVPPYSRVQSQQASTNFSRPSSRRETPCSFRRLSTLVWVEMPAWSRPTIQRVERPAMRL